ncbi:hypothetical protein ACIP2X_06805 [Streptomyces sp. NPDC089424]|uniref:hypothetical protein n=1 Tax=Streptomyces sp. NPDC089424 TaxID=3365917 RepID=UPI003801C539
MRAALPVAAATGVLVLAGCSQGDNTSSPGTSSAGSASAQAPAGNGELTVPQDVDEETKKQYLYQNALAVCMRAKGFTYTPRVEGVEAEAFPFDGQDYELAKEYRGKYGYGATYARVVYPNDANAIGSRAYTEKYESNPDQAYRDSLSPAQQRAYEKAFGELAMVDGKKTELPGCHKDATVRAYGPEKSEAERTREANASRAADRAAQQALDGDSRLVALAQDFASCLRGEGIPVTTTQPTSIGDMVKFAVNGQGQGVDELDIEAARAELAQEINVALADLECGRKFRAAYFPKLAKHPFTGLGG